MKKSSKNFNLVYSLVKEVSAAYPNSDLRNETLKVTEEAGELSAEILKLFKHKKSSQSRTITIKKIKSEAMDTIIATLSVLNQIGASEEELVNLCQKAVNKWKRKHLKQKTKKG